MPEHTPFILSEGSIKDLGNLVSSLKDKIETKGKDNTSTDPVREKQIRIGKTVSANHAYPSSGNTFEVEFGKPNFDDTTVGDQTTEFTAYVPQKVRVCHSKDNKYYGEGELVIVTLIHGKWYIVGAAGAGNIIIFEMLGDEYADEAYSELCEDKLEDAEMSYEALVLHRPCGVTRVEEETDAGTVVVHDDMGTWLANREAAEVGGRVGVAIYVQTEDYSQCHWSIIFLDWWREVQVISNVILTPDELKFEVKNVVVWDDCDLDPIIIPLTDCVEEY